MPGVCGSAVDGELKRLITVGKFISGWIFPRKLSVFRVHRAFRAVNATLVSEREGKAGGSVWNLAC